MRNTTEKAEKFWFAWLFKARKQHLWFKSYKKHRGHPRMSTSAIKICTNLCQIVCHLTFQSWKLRVLLVFKRLIKSFCATLIWHFLNSSSRFLQQLDETISKQIAILENVHKTSASRLHSCLQYNKNKVMHSLAIDSAN